MKLVKTGLLNGIATAVRVLSSLVLNKILAVFIGPSGYAMLGQFQNMMTLVTSFANGAINTGVTKYTAEYHDDVPRQHAIWRTAGALSLGGSLIAMTIIGLAHRPLAHAFLGSAEYSSVIVWFALSLALVVFNGLLLSILNGKKEIGLYVVANIAGSLIGAALSAVLASRLGVYGALLALATNQAMVFVVTLMLCRRTAWFRMRTLIGRPGRAEVRQLGKFSLMALTSAAVAPATQLLMRAVLSQRFGLEQAGYWQAMTKISDMYLMLITTPLAVYYLPRIAEIRRGRELRREILSGYALLLPVTAACGLTIYLFRDTIIALVFTRRFLPMRELFAWQLSGDVFKIAGWLLGYAIVGRGMVALFVASELIFGTTLVVLTRLLTASLGLVGITVAYCANYAMYWLFVAFFINLHVRQMEQRDVATEAT